MENNDTSFLGRGWSFPPEFTASGEDVMMVAGPEDVKQSLEILLGTRLEERILREEYGSNLHEFVFAEINTGLINRLRNMIEEAILYGEPRIRLNEVELDTDEQREGLLLIKVDYTIPNSNSRFNMVYPFYIQEGNF